MAAPPHRPPPQGPPPLAHQRLPGFQGYSARFSPFFESKLAVASAANYGIVGNGRLWILDLATQPGAAVPDRYFDTQDGLYDVAWSEQHERQLVTASGDGSLKLWDSALRDPHPVMHWQEHGREVFSVSWNMVTKDSFVSASWDRTIKLWNPAHQTSLLTLAGHADCVYAAVHHPRQATLVASGSADRTLRLWDTRNGTNVATAAFAHAHDVLSLDWDKYRPTVLYSGSADKDVKVWDTRRLDVAVATLAGHAFPVRRVAACPHRAGRVASVGYDMTARVWDTDLAALPPDHLGNEAMANVGAIPAGQVWQSDVHSEFVMGVDWALFRPGELATTSWDGTVCVHRIP
ncbi:WD40-repeat-containing domain protein [Blastocladiella britannica]|nr:WD40-repeat-containing domain protein [Blastocladiella britannica]